MVIDMTGYIGKWLWYSNPYMYGGLGKFIELIDKSKIDKSVIILTKSILNDNIVGNIEQSAKRNIFSLKMLKKH